MARMTEQALQSIEELLVGMGQKKLEAEDYSTEDLDAVTEGAFGSGNLNYLLLQQQQTNELQSIVQTKLLSDTSLGNGLFTAGGVADGSRLSESAPFETLGTAEPTAALTQTAQGVDADRARAGSEEAKAVAATEFESISPKELTAGATAARSDFADNGVNDATITEVGTPIHGTNGADGANGQDGLNGENGPEEPLPFLRLDIDGEGPYAVVDIVEDVLQSVVNGEVLTVVDGALDTVLQLTENVLGNLQDALSSDLSVANLLDVLPLSDLLNGNDLNLDLNIIDIAGFDLNLSDSLTLSPQLDVGLETGLPLVDGLVDTVEGLVNTDLNLGDTLGSLLSGDGNGDSDVALNLGIAGVDEGALLDPIEGVIGDVDLGINLDLTDGDLGLDSLVTLESDNAVLDAVGDGVETVLGAADDAVDALDGLTDGAIGDVVGDIGGALNGLLGGDGSGDSDVAADLGVVSLDEGAILDPVEDIIGDVDLGVNLDLTDGDLGLDSLVTLDAENPVLDEVGDGVEEALGTVDGVVNDALDGAGDALSSILNGQDGGDSDVAADLGVVSLDEGAILDPVEDIIGDVDLGVNLDLTDSDLGLDSLVTLDAENPVLDGVGDGVEEVLSVGDDVVDEALASVGDTLEPLGDTAGSLLDGPVGDALSGENSLLETLPDLTDGTGDLDLADLTNGEDALGELGLLNNPLPEPTGSVDDGMAVVDLGDQVLGGVFGLF